MVNSKDLDLQENEDYLVLINDIFKGTKAIKPAGETYLSKWSYETAVNYISRLDKAIFINFLKDAVSNSNSLLWRKGLNINYKNKFDYFFKDVDMNGNNLTEFFMSVSKNAILDGICYIWVDNQVIDATISKSTKIKPFLKMIKREDVVSKKYKTEGGTRTLTQMVLKQNIEVDLDDYETEIQETFIVLKPDTCYSYKIKSGKEEVLSTWDNELGYIPVFAVSSASTGFLEADIPFLDLAYMNIKHYNSASELDNILHMSAVPVQQIFTQTSALDENKAPIVLGSNNALIFSDKQTEGFEFKEVQGNGIAHIKANIDKLEENMIRMSVAVLSTESFKTATEANISEKNSSLFLVEIANSTEQGILKALLAVEDYIGEDMGFEIELIKDFSDLKLDAQTIDKMIMLKREGLISIDTLWDALIKGEVLDTFDYDVEKERIKTQNAELL